MIRTFSRRTVNALLGPTPCSPPDYHRLPSYRTRSGATRGTRGGRVRICHRSVHLCVRACDDGIHPAGDDQRGSPRVLTRRWDLRARQFVYGAPASIALRCGVICLAWPPVVADAEYVSPITASPIPNDHWLPQFQWPRSNPSSLIQTSPKGKCRNRTGWRTRPQGPHPARSGLQRAA